MKYLIRFFPTLLILFSNYALAAIDNEGILDNILDKYKAVASSWQNVLLDSAQWLFWSLVLISMVFTFSIMLLKKAEISEFFTEVVKFIIFTGFYLWILKNAPAIGGSIIKSLSKLAANAANVSDTPTPSSVVDIGFGIFAKILDQSSIWSPVDSAVGIIIGLIILVIIALVAINMLLLLITSWVLLYAGIFLLGFGGSKWTSDIAINYYKTLLGISIQCFTMILLIGIGKTFIDDYYNRMSDSLNFSELAVMLIVSIVLLYLTNKLPSLMSGIITGASVSGMGIGNFTAGAMVGAAATAAVGMSMAGKAFTSGATNIAGGARAIMEAMKANEGDSGNSHSDSDTSSDTSFDGSLSSAMGESASAGESGNDQEEPGTSSSASAGESGNDQEEPGTSSSASAGESGNGQEEPGTSSSASAGESGNGQEEPGTSSSASAGGSGNGQEEPGASSSASAGESDNGQEESAGEKFKSTMKNLASGISSFAKDTLEETKDSFNKKVDNSIGGKIAQKIKIKNEDK